MPHETDVSHPQASTASPPGSAFTCTLRTEGRDGAWIRVTGELDLASAPELKQTLRDAEALARHIVLDLRQLAFMDSSGLHLIIDATNRQRQAGRRFVLVRGAHQVDRLFTLAGMTEAVELIELDPSAPAVTAFDDPERSQARPKRRTRHTAGRVAYAGRLMPSTPRSAPTKR